MRVTQCFVLFLATGCVFMAGQSWAADEAPSPSPAPAPPANGPAPGHSYHGEHFDEGPRQKAYLMNSTGKVNFPITTSNPEAQAFFNQGVGQLHGFWYLEAERSFRQVVKLEPNCATAYWGMAMANINNEARAKKFIQHAVELKTHVSRREQLWIDSLAHFYEEGAATKKERGQKLIHELECIQYDFPEDLEASAFLVLQIWLSSRDDLPITSYRAVDAVLDQIFAAEPMHPAHHYRIHLWDSERPERALGSAALGGPASPGIAHMWHMPGHTYSHVRRYDDACYMQEASARVDHAHMQRDWIMPDQIHNYAHNNEWLVRNLVYTGRARDAVLLAKNLLELPRHPNWNGLDRGGSSANYGHQRLLDVLTTYEMWANILELHAAGFITPNNTAEEQVRILKVLGMAEFGVGNKQASLGYLASIQMRLAAKEAAKITQALQAERTAQAANEPEDKIAKARQDIEDQFVGELHNLRNAEKELLFLHSIDSGNVAFADSIIGGIDSARKERYARMYLEVGNFARAEELALEAAANSPQEVYPLANAVYVLYQAGKAPQAREKFDTLRTLAYQADLNTMAMRRLTPIAANFGYPSDWRTAPAPKADIGQRPPLDSLGPFRWIPAAAPGWSLPAADGSTISLADFQGKPVVLVFYLGSGCVHCVEQLKALAPQYQAFVDKGISVVAISTDDIESVKSSSQLMGEGTLQYPFPITSDSSNDVFKAYRCHDDFEEIPLHGTFLIDGQGRVRWQDIGAEPFMQMDFLLNEATRLLAIDPTPPDSEPSTTSPQTTSPPASPAPAEASAPTATTEPAAVATDAAASAPAP